MGLAAPVEVPGAEALGRVPVGVLVAGAALGAFGVVPVGLAVFGAVLLGAVAVVDGVPEPEVTVLDVGGVLGVGGVCDGGGVVVCGFEVGGAVGREGAGTGAAGAGRVTAAETAVVAATDAGMVTAGAGARSRYGPESTMTPFTMTSKCRWHPVDKPVVPT